MQPKVLLDLEQGIAMQSACFEDAAIAKGSIVFDVLEELLETRLAQQTFGPYMLLGSGGCLQKRPQLLHEALGPKESPSLQLIPYRRVVPFVHKLPVRENCLPSP